MEKGGRFGKISPMGNSSPIVSPKKRGSKISLLRRERPRIEMLKVDPLLLAILWKAALFQGKPLKKVPAKPPPLPLGRGGGAHPDGGWENFFSFFLKKIEKKACMSFGFMR
jgi:hypothetical protein